MIVAILFSLAFAACGESGEQSRPRAARSIMRALQREYADQPWFPLVDQVKWTHLPARGLDDWDSDLVTVSTTIETKDGLSSQEGIDASEICQAVEDVTSHYDSFTFGFSVEAVNGTDLSPDGCASPNSPWSITAGPDGNLWFTSPNAHQIGRMTPLGVVTMFPVHMGEYADQHEIVAGSDGNLWFTNGIENRIGRITPSGTVTRFTVHVPMTEEFSGFDNLTVGPDGALWFSINDKENAVARMTTDGKVTTYPDDGMFFVSGMTAGPDGNLWFVKRGGDAIGRITPSGEITTVTDLSAPVSTPNDITAGPDGNLWFTNAGTSSIGRITPAGEIITFTDPAGLVSGPTAITAGPDGNVWFLSVANNRIGRITPTGEITTFADPANNVKTPFGITAGSDGNVWFTSNDNSRIGRITPSGDITSFQI